MDASFAESNRDGGATMYARSDSARSLQLVAYTSHDNPAKCNCRSKVALFKPIQGL